MAEPVAYLIEGFDGGKLYAQIVQFTVDEARNSAAEFARHYSTVTTTALVRATPGAGLPAPISYTDEPWQDAICAKFAAAGFKYDGFGGWQADLTTPEMIALGVALGAPKDGVHGASPDFPRAEPCDWQLIDPQGRVAATEPSCIKAWARIYGYKPTVENLLGYEQNGWRVQPVPRGVPAAPTDHTHSDYADGFDDGKAQERERAVRVIARLLALHERQSAEDAKAEAERLLNAALGVKGRKP